MGIEKVGAVWKEYCLQNIILKSLLPISVPLLMASSGLCLVENFISLGSVVTALIYVLFILSVLLTFAKSEYRTMAIGIGIYTVDFLYSFLYAVIKFRVISWSAIIYLLVWGFLAYMAYKKSLKLGEC